MDYDYNANMQKIDEYIQIYTDYSDFEKLENRHIIDDYILKILEARYIKFYDLKTLLDVHNKILKLERIIERSLYGTDSKLFFRSIKGFFGR